MVADAKKGSWVNSDGTEIDLGTGIAEPVMKQPLGFVSKHSFVESDLAARIKSIDWFAHCGEPVSLDVSMEIVAVPDWPSAIASCKDPVWDFLELESQNQLSSWLHVNDHAKFQAWNEIVDAHKTATVNTLTEEKIVPFQAEHGLDVGFVNCVRWDILAPLMENSYLGSGHRAFFFLELLMIYEAGHFPCGWDGGPRGRLRVF